MRFTTVALWGLLVGGCGGAPAEGDPQLPSDSPAARAGTSDTTPAAAAGSPAGAADTVVQPPEDGWTAGTTTRRRPAARVGTVAAVRIATHGDFDRLVIELAEGAMPGYVIEPADGPVLQCGSGLPAEISGDSFLRIRLEPARAHTDEGEPTLTMRRWPVGLPIIREAVLTCDFEAQVEIAAAVDGPARYRVMELTGPARLVVDVRRDPGRRARATTSTAASPTSRS